MLEIITDTHPNCRGILSTDCFELWMEQIVNPVTQQLIDDMIATVTEVEGAGLAANQVGQSVRIIVVRMDAVKVEIMINPRIVACGNGISSEMESCLSFPGKRNLVRRHKMIKVSYQDRAGVVHLIKLHGIFARIVQHEIDHLNGVTIFDRMPRAA